MGLLSYLSNEVFALDTLGKRRRIATQILYLSGYYVLDVGSAQASFVAENLSYKLPFSLIKNHNDWLQHEFCHLAADAVVGTSGAEMAALYVQDSLFPENIISSRERKKLPKINVLYLDSRCSVIQGMCHSVYNCTISELPISTLMSSPTEIFGLKTLASSAQTQHRMRYDLMSLVERQDFLYDFELKAMEAGIETRAHPDALRSVPAKIPDCIHMAGYWGHPNTEEDAAIVARNQLPPDPKSKVRAYGL